MQSTNISEAETIMSKVKTRKLPDTDKLTQRSVDTYPVKPKEQLISQAQAEQVPQVSQCGTHMLFEWEYKGETHRKHKTFYGKNEHDLKLQIDFYIRKCGIKKAYTLTQEDLEKIQNESNTQIQSS